MTIYNIELDNGILKVGFGKEPASNDLLVREAAGILTEMIKSGEISGGEILKVSGPASLPVAMQIAAKVQHLFGAIAVFDPKMQKYVVAITHNPSYQLGGLVE